LPKKTEIRSFFETLSINWGPQNWWPADSPFEVIVGAILTQNAAWTNVEKALANLRRAEVLSLEGIRKTPVSDMEALIRPAGFFRQKAARLKSFVAWLDSQYAGSLENMFLTPSASLRSELLELNGIGPETADSILLYAGQREIVVVDAYTRRIFERHRLVKPTAKYDEIRTMVELSLQSPAPTVLESALLSPTVEPGPGPAEEVLRPVVHTTSNMSKAPRSEVARTYNEFHALIVQVAKHYCQSRVARCELCPLRGYLKHPVQIQKAPYQGTALAVPKRQNSERNSDSKAHAAKKTGARPLRGQKPSQR
jgi:endonuclease-3 related protein